MRNSLGCLRPFVRNMQPLALSLLVLLSAPGLLLAAQPVDDALPKLSGQTLIEQLKTGGYVLYFRHGSTNNAGEDRDGSKRSNSGSSHSSRCLFPQFIASELSYSPLWQRGEQPRVLPPRRWAGLADHDGY